MFSENPEKDENEMRRSDRLRGADDHLGESRQMTMFHFDRRKNATLWSDTPFLSLLAHRKTDELMCERKDIRDLERKGEVLMNFAITPLFFLLF